ncbi:LacI family transcriptional regulator [Evansella caseinilytica]|uniref:LacI family transcriptional regulator n=1 Tax=Evansella caseinilytica TaxID=1503961 RepID=A0A1H3QEX6_9BACI|nr:LacI family DNA-binding transcriptional regulator [Evansella caseinilytica]SDZ11565.1 LacI family transcriptional regulator [Evansella caseinilytica]
MRITIKEIAKLAGVSQATVSKIINNYQDVGEDTKKRVLKIMEEKGYRPSHSAKTLASKVTNVIGVLYAGKVNVGFNHPFFVDVMDMFKKKIGYLGYDLMFFSNEKFFLDEEDYLARCLHYNVDGCIIIGGEDIQESVYDVDKSPIPCIGIDIKLTGEQSGYLMTDNYKVSSKVVEHYYLLGHREIAYIGGKKDSVIADIRLSAFREVMGQYGLPVREEMVKYGDFFEGSGYRAMKELLHAPVPPKAVFAASDLMAFGAIQAIKEHGLKVPDDISVIGCDDISAAKHIDPPLTTVRQDSERIGNLAARMLFDLINHRINSTSVMVEPELMVRKSSGPAYSQTLMGS